MKIDLSQKVALITGGSRGIGAATSFVLASAGATVAINYLQNKKHAQKLSQKIHRRKFQSFLIQGDVSDFLQAESVVHQIIDRMGRLDIVVNNAGIWEKNPLDNPRAEEAWDKTIKVNLKSVFNVCVHALPHLAKTGGRIINVSSSAGQRGEANYSHYAASKGGIIAFTKSLACELAHQQILVNAVAPGWVWTDMSTKHLTRSSYRKEALKQIPLGKIAQPEDVANAILFLASPLANHITGEVINVNGGSVLNG